MTEQLSLFSSTDYQTDTTASCRSERNRSLRKPQEQQILFPELIEILSCRRRSRKSIGSGRRTSRQPRHYEIGQIVAVGRKGIPIGEDASQAKFLDSDVAQVFALREEGYSFAQIGECLDMGKSTAWAIVHGHIRGQFPADYRRIHEKRKKA